MSADDSRSQLIARDQPVMVEWRAKGWKCLEAAQLISEEGHGASLALNKSPELGQLVCLTFPSNADAPQGRRAPGRQEGVWALVWATSGAHEDSRQTEMPHRDLISVLYLDEGRAGNITQTGADRFVYTADREGNFSLSNDAREAAGRAPTPSQPRASSLSNKAREAAAVASRRNSRRVESRLELPFEVTAEIIGGDGEVVARETAVTENVSRGGAALRTTLNVAPQRIVRLTIAEGNVVLNSVVCAFRVGPDGIARAHLKFTDGEWPLGNI